jgi:inactive STAND
VAKNRCELTKDGCNVLKQLLDVVYPGGCTETALSEDTGLTRDTLDKIFEMLHRNPQKPVKPVQYIKLEQLFDRLYRKLEQPDQDQYRFQPRYCREVVGSTQPKRDKASPIDSSVLIQQKLAMCLDSLNYTIGQATFTRLLSQCEPTGAFLLQVSDTKVQSWLVKRLAKQVPGFENGRRLEINVALLGGNFEYFWADLAKQLRLPYETAEATIASLSELCQEKTVIIVLSRLQRVDEGIQQRLMDEFWLPLAKQICAQSRDWRSRLVLFLVQDGVTSQHSSSPFKRFLSDQADPLVHPVMLEPLVEFASHDVRFWFAQEGFELLATQIGEEEAEKCIQQNQIFTWEPHPWDTLENICNVFRTKIADIERYWKLAG